MAPHPSAEDYKRRQLILQEWQAKHDAATATKNIRAKLGKDAITSTRVLYWYKRFDNGDVTIFNKQSAMHSLTHGNLSVGVRDPVSSVIMITKDKFLGTQMLTSNGRFVIFPNCEYRQQRLTVFYDLFHGTKKEIPSLFDYANWCFAMVGNYVLQLMRGRNKLCIVKIDFSDLTASAFEPIDLEKGLDFGSIVSDQMSRQNFMIQSNSKVVFGYVKDDQFNLEEGKRTKLEVLVGKRLLGRKLQAFSYQNGPIQFCEFNFETMKMKRKEAPIVINDEVQIVKDFYTNTFCWSQNRYFGIHSLGGGDHKIIAFDLSTFTWAEVNISVRHEMNLHVDSDGVLMLHLAPKDKDSMFYRFPMKKPDTLANFTWLFLMRNSTIFETNIYEKILKRLPLDCELRSWIQEDQVKEEKIKEQPTEENIEEQAAKEEPMDVEVSDEIRVKAEINDDEEGRNMKTEVK